MTTQILISGYDFTNDVYDLPTIEYNLPEWGKIQEQIINQVLNLDLPISCRTFFDTQEIRNIEVIVNIDNKPQFKGFVDVITYTLNKLTLQCKSYTSLLFNGLLGTQSAYVISDKLPIEIFKELMELAGLNINLSNYQDEYQRQFALDLRFSVAIESLSYAEVLTKLCENACAIIYQDKDEFIFEMFNPDSDYPSIEITNNDWITYPVIETMPAFSSSYNGTDIQFGASLLLYGLENPTQVIDMSTSSIVYTSRMDNAVYIAYLYDYLGEHRKKRLTATLRKSVADILEASSVFEWNGNKYELINLTASVNFGSEVLAESVE